MTDPVTVVAHDVATVGGMERQLTFLIEGLLAAGRQVTVVSRTCTIRHHPRLAHVRVPTPSRPFSLAYPLFFLVGSWRTWRHRRGIVHSTGAIVLNRVDVATVHYCHAAAPPSGGRARGSRSTVWHRANAVIATGMALAAERWCYRRRVRSALVAVSSGVADELQRAYPNRPARIEVIPNGVDCDHFRPDDPRGEEVRERLLISTDAMVAVFVGGDWVRKGLAYAVAAIAQVPDVELIVVGPGDRKRYQAMAANAGAAGRVHFVGPQTDVRPFYGAADVFLMPSEYEAFSLVAFEAAACGLPLLITAVNGAVELVRDGVTGHLIERSVDDIARRLRDLRDNPARRRAMGVASRAAAVPRGWDGVIESYGALYDRIGASLGQDDVPPRPSSQCGTA